MEWFSSVEFYVIAVTCALLLVGMIFNHPTPERVFTYIYRAYVDYLNISDNEEDIIKITPTERGEVRLSHQGVLLPTDIDINIVVDVQGDKVKLVEKLASSSQGGEMHTAEINCVLSCLKNRKYHLRYESEYSGKWTTFTFVNNGDSEIKSNMKY